MTQSADPWLDLQPSSYQADGEKELGFPAHEIGEDGSLRVAPRARPWQAGEKLDHTGPNADELMVMALFHNDVQEPGLEGITLWPDQLEALVAQFKTGKTATLNLPWKRGLRVKPLTWSRRATAIENRGGETISIKFKTDNEDDLDRDAFQKVSVKATAQSSVETAQFDMESEGMWDGSIEDITELAADLVGLLNAPGDYSQAIEHAANRVARACNTVMSALSSKVAGRDGMNDPQGGLARQRLLELQELAARSAGEARAQRPKTRTITTDRATDIWTIATTRSQDPRALMAINGAIEDFSAIPKGTAVLIFAE